MWLIALFGFGPPPGSYSRSPDGKIVVVLFGNWWRTPPSMWLFVLPSFGNNYHSLLNVETCWLFWTNPCLELAKTAYFLASELNKTLTAWQSHKLYSSVTNFFCRELLSSLAPSLMVFIDSFAFWVYTSGGNPNPHIVCTQAVMVSRISAAVFFKKYSWNSFHFVCLSPQSAFSLVEPDQI